MFYKLRFQHGVGKALHILGVGLELPSLFGEVAGNMYFVSRGCVLTTSCDCV
jgi:hypothetical protein